MAHWATMTDAAATPPPSIPERLLALQAVDTEADQLTLQRERHPLRDAFVAASRELAAWETRRGELRGRIDELAAAIERAEEEGADLTSSKVRLEAQLKTVIAPREFEALMHEIATIDEQRDALDLQELEALEEQSLRDEELSRHLDGEETTRESVRRTDQELSSAVNEIDRELATLDERRSDLRAGLDDTMLATYDRKRAALGVAAATLVGRQCQGCHLDLSAAEVDTVKDEAAATGVTDCPQCGRLLVV